MINTGHIISIEQGEQQLVEAIGVGRRANFIVVKCGRAFFGEPRHDPIDGAGVSIERDAHRQGNSQNRRVGPRSENRLFGERHRFAIDGHRVSDIIFGMVAAVGSRVNEIDRKMNEAKVASGHRRQQVLHTADIDAMGHFGVGLASLKPAVSAAIDNGVEVVGVKERTHRRKVARIDAEHAFMLHLPCLFGAGANDLFAEAFAKKGKRIEAGNPGRAGDQYRRN